MIVKKYLADSEEKAIEIATKELGSEAIVLTKRHMKPKGIRTLFAREKVEITVAVDEKDMPTSILKTVSHDEGNALKGLGDNLSDLKRVMGGVIDSAERVEDPCIVQDHVVISKDASYDGRSDVVDKIHKQSIYDIKQFSDRIVSHFSRDNLPELAKEETILRKEQSMVSTDDKAMRKLVREEIVRAYCSVAVETPVDVDCDEIGSIPFLQSKGISRSIAIHIDELMDRRFGPSEDAKDSTVVRMNALKNEIASLITVTGPIRLRNEGAVTLAAFVGPAGVGKTSIVMKIAAQYVQELGKDVAIFSFDIDNFGSRERIRTFAESLRIPVKFGKEGYHLTKAVEEFEDKDLILIDTGGRCRYDWEQADDVFSCLRDVRGIKTYLTVSATTKDLDIFGTIRQFSMLDIEGLIFTKLDETIAHGVVANVCYKSGIPISYLAAGRNIPDDICIADANDIAKGILMRHNARSLKILKCLPVVSN